MTFLAHAAFNLRVNALVSFVFSIAESSPARGPFRDLEIGMP